LQVERVEAAGVVEDDVYDEPVVEVAEVVDGERDEVAHGAVRAVAADDVASAYLVSVGCADGDAVVVGGEVVDLDAPAHLDRAQSVSAFFKQRFERGLVEHRRQRPTQRLLARSPEAQQRRARRVAPLVDVGRFGDAAQLVGHPTGLEDAPDFVVEMHRARQGVDRRIALVDRDGQSGQAEQISEQRADRAVAVLEAGEDDAVLHLGHLRAHLDQETIGRCAAPRRIPGPPHALPDRPRPVDV